MKKFILIVIGFLAIAYVGIYIYLDNQGPKVVVSEEQQEAVKTELDKNFETVTPQGEMPEYEIMDEVKLLDEVHGMTHQKVKADQKWGSSEITRDKVEKLYDIATSKEFKNNKIQNMLVEILEPWIKGDFSHAVEDHNKIWNYKKGNIGKATRLLTPVEEQEYIEKYFR